MKDKENLKEVKQRLKSWWDGEQLDRACISFSMPKLDTKEIGMQDLNQYWPLEDREPDLEGLVSRQIESIEKNVYFGEAIPTFPHSYGGRGTPMVMAMYLGGDVKFKSLSVWVEPIIEDWKKFDIKFDAENIWYKRSYELFKLAVEKCSERNIVPWLPDFGDALTVFSLLRGNERLLLDLIDDKEAVIQARDRFIAIWMEFHKSFWQVYSQKFQGDTSWMTWAPGKTYACQCDFSTMISPAMFEELVVPEIEKMGHYLDYIVWHFDGPEDEIKHLDILLNLPEIKAIQWNPSPKNSVLAFLPYFKKIQKRNKRLIVFPESEKEIKTLLQELSPKGLFIFGGFTGKTEKEALKLMKMVSNSRKHPY